MTQEGAPTLEQTIRALAAEGTLTALNEHLPVLLARLVLPPDGEHRHTLTEAAERLRIPFGTFEKRVKAGEINVLREGKFAFVLERELVRYNRVLCDREQFRRDQKSAMPKDVSPEIAALLEPKKQKAKR